MCPRTVDQEKAFFGILGLPLALYFFCANVRCADDVIPVVGLIQSAIGGSQIEAWMDNTTLVSVIPSIAIIGAIKYPTVVVWCS